MKIDVRPFGQEGAIHQIDVGEGTTQSRFGHSMQTLALDSKGETTVAVTAELIRALRTSVFHPKLPIDEAKRVDQLTIPLDMLPWA